MVSVKDKRELVKVLIEQTNSAYPCDDIQRQLHHLLLRDTNNGKLYKYRRFDANGYALSDLANGTLYCSRPTSFNDPFDCKIGITLESLTLAAFDAEYEWISVVIEKFLLVARGELEIGTCSLDEQRIIDNLLAENSLANLLCSQHCNHDPECDSEFKANQLKALCRALRIILSDEKFIHSIGSSAEYFARLFENISPDSCILKNESASVEDFAKDNGIFEDVDEIETVMLLNGKLCPELIPQQNLLRPLIDNLEYQLERMKNLFLIGCLCTDYKNRLMWSHYAENHSGFCVEYDFSGDDPSALTRLPLPVCYSAERPLIPWQAFLSQDLQQARTELTLGLLAKDNAWEYEKEWRIIRSSNESPHLKMPRISCIYLGAAIQNERKSEILEIAAAKKIPVKQMTIDRGKYALHAKPVNYLE